MIDAHFAKIDWMNPEHRDFDEEERQLEKRQQIETALEIIRIGDRRLDLITKMYAFIAEVFDDLPTRVQEQVLQLHRSHMIKLQDTNQQPGAVLLEEHRAVYLQVFGLLQTEEPMHALRIAPGTTETFDDSEPVRVPSAAAMQTA